ncbi:MAG: hypothetical protein KAY75_05165 [Limnohabitans sp.]|jgi:hypothetical protein|nr:hypothetical protein [Limnohabitans sp.]
MLASFRVRFSNGRSVDAEHTHTGLQTALRFHALSLQAFDSIEESTDCN